MSNVKIANKITEYCDFAVIHIVWMVKRNETENGSDRYLVFGMVECYPKELESPLTICEQGNKFNGGLIYYIRITKPIETAVEWYRSIKKNGFITIDWEEHNKNQNSGSIEKRIHQMFPEEREPFLLDFIMHEKVGRWLEKYLAWNISYYPELIPNIYARRYANLLLNGIHLCESWKELHEHPRGGLMKDGMYP